jgi:hypothetical protein
VVVTTTASLTAGNTYLADATSGPMTLTLPTAPATGSSITVTKIDSSINGVTIAAGSGDNITGVDQLSAVAASPAVAALTFAAQGDSISLVYLNSLMGSAYQYSWFSDGSPNGTPVFNVKAFGATGDGRQVTDGVTTALSTSLSSAAAGFTSADVNKRVVVSGSNIPVSLINGSPGAVQPNGAITTIKLASVPVAINVDDTIVLTNTANASVSLVATASAAVSTSPTVVDVSGVSNAVYLPGQVTANDLGWYAVGVSAIDGSTSPVFSGNPITSIELVSVPQAISKGDMISMSEGSSTLVLTTTAAYSVSSTATTVSVTSINANATYTPGSCTAQDTAWPLPFTAQITSVSSGVATLNNAAPWTVASATITWGNDDYEAITNALLAAQAWNGTVALPAGIYVCNSEVSSQPQSSGYVRIQGAGKYATVLIASDSMNAVLALKMPGEVCNLTVDAGNIATNALVMSTDYAGANSATNASISLGSTSLSFASAPSNPPSAGSPITVNGAGPGGAPLTTTVVMYNVGPNTYTLAAPCLGSGNPPGSDGEAVFLAEINASPAMLAEGDTINSLTLTTSGQPINYGDTLYLTAGGETQTLTVTSIPTLAPNTTGTVTVAPVSAAVDYLPSQTYVLDAAWTGGVTSVTATWGSGLMPISEFAARRVCVRNVPTVGGGGAGLEVWDKAQNCGGGAGAPSEFQIGTLWLEDITAGPSDCTLEECINIVGVQRVFAKNLHMTGITGRVGPNFYAVDYLVADGIVIDLSSSDAADTCVFDCNLGAVGDFVVRGLIVNDPSGVAQPVITQAPLLRCEGWVLPANGLCDVQLNAKGNYQRATFVNCDLGSGMEINSSPMGFLVLEACQVGYKTPSSGTPACITTGNSGLTGPIYATNCVWNPGAANNLLHSSTSGTVWQLKITGGSITAWSGTIADNGTISGFGIKDLDGYSPQTDRSAASFTAIPGEWSIMSPPGTTSKAYLPANPAAGQQPNRFELLSASSSGEDNYTLETTDITPITFRGTTLIGAGDLSITAVSTGGSSPTTITCSTDHGLTTGAVVVITGFTGSAAGLNGTWAITTVSGQLTEFTIAVANSAALAGSPVVQGGLQISCQGSVYELTWDATNNTWRAEPISEPRWNIVPSISSSFSARPRDLVIVSSASPTITAPVPLYDGVNFAVKNTGGGTLTIAPDSGAHTVEAQSGFTLSPGSAAELVWDGTSNWMVS